MQDFRIPVSNICISGTHLLHCGWVVRMFLCKINVKIIVHVIMFVLLYIETVIHVTLLFTVAGVCFFVLLFLSVHTYLCIFVFDNSSAYNIL